MDKHCVESIRTEFSNKIINARANEFFKARKELNLEENRKVVDVDQSLRDTLSAMKSRNL